MTNAKRILDQVVFFPNEKVLEIIPAKAEGMVIASHLEAQNHPVMGKIDFYLPAQVREPAWRQVKGFFVLTTMRMIFVADDKIAAPFPEVMYEIALHNIVEVASRGLMNKSLHVDAHTPQGVMHFTFHGNELAKQARSIKEIVLQHDAADYWRGQKKGLSTRCKKCKKQIQKGLRYCPYCGTRQA